MFKRYVEIEGLTNLLSTNGKFLGFNYRDIRKAALSRGKEVFEGYGFRLSISNEPWPTV